MGIRRPSRIDLAYAAVVAVPVIVLAIFALLGSSFATYALPSVVGALLGSSAARLMTVSTAPRLVQAAAVLLAGLAVVLAALVLASPLINPSWLDALGLLGSRYTVLGLFAGGFAFLFFTEILRRVTLPSLYPSTPEEDQQLKLEKLRGTLILGGLVLAMTVGGLLIFGAMALIAYVVAQLSTQPELFMRVLL
jgi:hypothetical protein